MPSEKDDSDKRSDRHRRDRSRDRRRRSRERCNDRRGRSETSDCRDRGRRRGESDSTGGSKPVLTPAANAGTPVPVAKAGAVVPAEAGTPVPAKAGTPVPVAKAGTPAPAADDIYDEEEEEEEESDQTIDVPVVPLAAAPLPGPGQVPGPATETGKPAGGAAPGSSTLTAQVSRRSSPPEPANPPKPKVAAPADKTKSTVFDCAVCGRRVGGGQAGLSQHRRSAHHLACWVYWSQGQKKPWQDCEADGRNWSRVLWAKNEEGPSDEEALTTKRKKEKTGQDVPRNIERLALAFGHCPVRLKDQYARLMPIATAVKRQSSVTNRGAWKEALLRTSASKGSQNDKYEQTELREVVAAYQGWTAASSGVEQLFSKMKRSPVALSNGSAETDRRTAIVMGDGLSSMTETVAKPARFMLPCYAQAQLGHGHEQDLILARKV